MKKDILDKLENLVESKKRRKREGRDLETLIENQRMAVPFLKRSVNVWLFVMSFFLTSLIMSFVYTMVKYKMIFT